MLCGARLKCIVCTGFIAAYLKEGAAEPQIRGMLTIKLNLVSSQVNLE